MVRREDGWHCVAVVPSCGAFMTFRFGGDVEWSARQTVGGDRVCPADLLRQAARLLGGAQVDLVAVDMPLARSPVRGRRRADDEVSRQFAAAWCGTHSPTAQRPGVLSDILREEFEAEGYRLATKGVSAERSGRAGGAGHLIPAEPGQTDKARTLIEVYPHAALLTLLTVDRRVPYKVNKTLDYWPHEPLATRRRHLVLVEQHRILRALRTEIQDIDLPLPQPDSPGTLASLKPFEDALDALVCCWVGIRYLEGKAVAYGDEDAAVWVPR